MQTSFFVQCEDKSSHENRKVLCLFYHVDIFDRK